jgi:hypothetical protein
MPADPIKVVLLSQDHCGLCDHAKEVLGRIGADFPMAVETVDMKTSPGREMAEDAGILFPPGLLIDGKPFSYGRVSERKLRRTLAGVLGPRS